jgi:hypothetical protein
VQDDEFREKLEQLVPLVLSYGIDALKIPLGTKPEEISRYAHPQEFITKCHEGFKLAQERLLNALLSIEDEMKILDRRMIESRRESQETFESQLKTEFEKLQFQRASFKEVANVIAWTLLRGERAHIRALMKVGMWDGYLRDRNITSVVNEAEKINRDPDSFALITDITSCLGMGDMLVTRKGRMAIVEVKEGKVSELIGKLLTKPSTVNDGDLDALRKLSPAKVLDQAERYRRQTAAAENAIQYIQTDHTEKDQMTGLPKSAVDPLSPPEHLWEGVNETIRHIQVGQWRYLHTDVQTIGILRPNVGYVSYVSRLDFQHYLYHEKNVPWEKCQYTCREDGQFTRPECMDYESIPVYSMRQKIFSPTRMPIFLMLGPRNGIDVLTDTLRIYVYFDVDLFHQICQGMALQPSWMTQKEYRRSLGRQLPHKFGPPLFPRGYLSFGESDNRRVFMHGMLENLVFELETGTSVARKLKTKPPTRSQPRSSKEA